MVDPTGFEPVAFSMPWRRDTNFAKGPSIRRIQNPIVKCNMYVALYSLDMMDRNRYTQLRMQKEQNNFAFIDSQNELERRLGYKKKEPHTDGTV